MASLYIKNAETAGLAREVAALLGTTKTEAVHDALLRRKRELSERSGGRAGEMLAKLQAWREAHPLPPATGGPANKAFFDEMWDDPD